MMKPRLILAIVLVVGTGMVLIFAWLRSGPPVAAALGEFSEAGVQVDLSLEQSSAAPCVLAARYTPLQEHFHVYSKDSAAGWY